ncbi:hypothetical protein KKH43_03015 [Patescibacteria group bacterium]|nr:hypothetical protein [Patescibacteria group bacterium]
MTKENPYLEVNGQTVYAVVDGMGTAKEMGMRILSENGIDDPVPNEWYSQEEWLSAFKQIAENIGPHTLFAIGRSIPKNAEFPSEIDDIEKALASIDVAYHMNHKIDGEPMFNEKDGSMKEGIGHYTFKKTGDKQAEVICDNPYPCDFDKGIVKEMAQRFKPEDSLLVKVEHDETDECRKKGDKVCTYTVTW